MKGWNWKLLFLFACILFAASKLVFAMGENVAGVGANSGMDPIDAVFGTLLLVSIAGGMPAPEIWGTMTVCHFLYLWAYNSANNLCQNMGKASSSSMTMKTRAGDTLSVEEKHEKQ